MMQRNQLASLSYACSGSWGKISRALSEQTEFPHLNISENYITILDDAYPDCLRKLRYPPWVLFYQGDISLLKTPMMTIVGSRNLTVYGEACTKEAASILKKRFTLVSGLAKGADGIVHACALDKGKTIAVIGSGLGTRYPACNASLYKKIAEKGLILSEYPYSVPVRREHFPWRNRILAALGESVIVTQASVHSGTMITVNEALALSKDIYCFPYPFGTEEGRGADLLIAEGAEILYDSAQLKDLIPHQKVKGRP